MEQTTTEQLVQDYLSGNQMAAAELLNRFGGMAYAVINHLLYGQGDKDDVYQEACVRAFTSLQNLSDPARFGGWFKQIAIRTTIDYLRRRRFSSELLNDSLADERPGPEALIIELDARRQVRQAVYHLPEHYRHVIVLYYWSDCSYQEIAEALNIPPGTVMSRLHKAKHLLSQLLSDYPDMKEGAGRWT